MIQQLFDYAKEKGFSYEEIVEYCKKHKVPTHPKVLYYYGQKCNWKTRKGERFSNLAVFVNVYNGVWLEKQRKIKEEQNRWKEDFYRALGKE